MNTISRYIPRQLLLGALFAMQLLNGAHAAVDLGVVQTSTIGHAFFNGTPLSPSPPSQVRTVVDYLIDQNQGSGGGGTLPPVSVNWDTNTQFSLTVSAPPGHKFSVRVPPGQYVGFGGFKFGLGGFLRWESESTPGGFSPPGSVEVSFTGLEGTPPAFTHNSTPHSVLSDSHGFFGFMVLDSMLVTNDFAFTSIRLTATVTPQVTGNGTEDYVPHVESSMQLVYQTPETNDPGRFVFIVPAGTNTPPTNTNNVAPVVNLVHPTNGAAFRTSHSTIRLTANATDTDGTVSFVEFFAGLRNLGRVYEPTTNGLYELSWPWPPSGMYQVRAEAVDDMGARSVSASVPITVSGLDGVTPELDPISNRYILEDAGSQTVALSGIGPGDTNASGPLTVSALSTKPDLIPNPVINYTSPNANGSLILTPVANAFGTAAIIVRVRNGQPTSNVVSQSFLVTVVPINDLPLISAISDRTINENTATAIAFTVQDVETPASSLMVSGSSSNPTLVPSANLAFGGSGTNRALTVIPAPDQSGTTTITIVAQDGDGGTASSSFSLTVGALPMIRVISVSPETGVDLIIYGLAGRTHIVECSEDTVTWTPIYTAEMPQAASMAVRDASATFVASRFYRVIELP